MRGVRWASAGVFIVAALSWSARAEAQCAADEDCKGGRVCQSGSCVDVGCTKDTECSGEQVCHQGQCVAPSDAAPPAAPPPAAPPPAAPPPAAPPPAAPPVAAPPAVPAPMMGTQASQGTLVVTTPMPAMVRINGGESGTTPLTIELPPGKYGVVVEFESGGRASSDAFVTAGQQSDVHIEPTLHRQKWWYRRGPRLGVSVAPAFLFQFESPSPDVSRNDDDDGPPKELSPFYFGGRATAFLNLAPIPALDFRVGAFGTATKGEEGGLAPIGGVALMKMNLGSIYSLMVGGFVGYGLANEVVEPAYCDEVGEFESDPLARCDILHQESSVFFGPKLSVATFTFGERREIEVSLEHGVAITTGELAVWHDNTLNFTYLFVGDESPMTPASQVGVLR